MRALIISVFSALGFVSFVWLLCSKENQIMAGAAMLVSAGLAVYFTATDPMPNKPSQKKLI